MTTMNDYSPAVFAAQVGRVFEFERSDLQPAADRVQFELLEVVTPRAAVRDTAFREPFTLLFALRGCQQPGLGLHRIAQADFEPCDWFLNRVVVPGRDTRQTYYQAVFG